MTTCTHSKNPLGPLGSGLGPGAVFLDATAELETRPPAARITECHDQRGGEERSITPDERLAAGGDQSRAGRKTPNRLRLGEESSSARVGSEPQTTS